MAQLAVTTISGASPWDGFQIGPENALAHSAALALARGERAGLSPLLLHGPPGVGKSRLLDGLAAELLARHPAAAIARVTAEEFAADCAEAAARRGGWAEARLRYRNLDLLALDDLHALERAPLALQELEHTLDALEAADAAVALATRLPPGQGTVFPRRLLGRLTRGLAVRIEPPSIEARRRFLLDRARARGFALPAHAIERLAAAADGYRDLEGLLARLGFEARLGPRALGDAAIDALLNEPGTLAVPPSIDQVAKAVAHRFRVPLRELRGPSRRAAVAEPRHLAMLLARRHAHAHASFAAIGRYFGRRDPATVRHACAVAEARINAAPDLAAAVEALAATWRRPTPPPD